MKCDCGGEVAGTGHSDWCSSNGEGVIPVAAQSEVQSLPPEEAMKKGQAAILKRRGRTPGPGPRTLQPGEVALKVSPKGAVYVYGVQRFPITMYQNQWKTLLANADKIRKFIDENERVLVVK